MTVPPDRPPKDTSDPPEIPRPEPVYCVIGDTLREVRVWTEEEWERLDPSRRPSPAEYVSGVGWVAPVITSGPG